MSEIQRQIEENNTNLRREASIRHVLYGLRRTIQLQGMTPDTKVDEVRAEFTDKSAAFIAPLVEAVDILEAIIFASDGCRGHRECAHSMEPWQRARALLYEKWNAASDGRQWPDVTPTK